MLEVFDTLDVIAFTGSLAAGLTLGFLYFGSLWFTTQRLATVNNPLALLGISLVIRVSLVLIAFFAFLQISIACLLFAVSGFVFARMAMCQRLGRDIRPNAEDCMRTG